MGQSSFHELKRKKHGPELFIATDKKKNTGQSSLQEQKGKTKCEPELFS